jgi:hypothetical protein
MPNIDNVARSVAFLAISAGALLDSHRADACRNCAVPSAADISSDDFSYNANLCSAAGGNRYWLDGLAFRPFSQRPPPGPLAGDAAGFLPTFAALLNITGEAYPLTDPCLDLSIPHVGQWYASRSISIPNSQVVAGAANSISVTLASNSGASGPVNLYIGPPVHHQSSATGCDPHAFQRSLALGHRPRRRDRQ